MPDYIRNYLKKLVPRSQRKPEELKKAASGVAGLSSLGAASVQPPAQTARRYSLKDVAGAAVTESEPLSDEEQALLDKAKNKGGRARSAAEAYAAQYRRQ